MLKSSSSTPNCSFIVPIYNGERFLANCIDSLLNSGLNETEFEILCLDDCSSDRSREIILDYAGRYNNIKYIFNDVNLKTSTSLNNGLKHARGKYIWIIGQDDYIAQDSAIKLLQLCEKDNLEVLAFNYNRVDTNGNLITSDKPFVNTTTEKGKNFVKTYFNDTFCIYLLGYEWRAIYNREFLIKNNISFPDNTIYEDTLFMFKAFWKAKKMKTIEDCIYNYRQNNASVTDVTKRYQAFRIFDFFMVSDEVLGYAETIDDEHIKKQLINISKMYLKSFTYTITPAVLTEKKKFYSLVKKNWKRISVNIQIMPFYIRLLLHPHFGIILTLLLKPFFQVKNLTKRKIYKNI